MKNVYYYVTRFNLFDGSDWEYQNISTLKEARKWAKKCRYYTIRKINIKHNSRDIIETTVPQI